MNPLTHCKGHGNMLQIDMQVALKFANDLHKLGEDWCSATINRSRSMEKSLAEPSSKPLSSTYDIQRAVDGALRTIHANLVTFADRYPDDTTVRNVYRLRPALNSFA